MVDLLPIGLSVGGAAAICAAAAGALAGGVRWTGARLGMAVAAGALAGAVVGGATFAGPSLPDLQGILPKLVQASDAADMERVLKTYYPDDYAQAQSALSALKSGQATQEQTEDALRAIGYPLMARQISLASTDNTVAYFELTREENAALAKNPELCGRVLDDPGPDAMGDIAAALPEDLKEREARLDINVLEQTALHPQPPRPTALIDDQVSMLGRDAVWSLSFDERDALRGGGEAHGAAACKAFGTMLDTIGFNSPGVLTEIFKAVLAKGAAKLQTASADPARG